MNDLYTPSILRLSTRIPHLGVPEQWRFKTVAVSRICGSRLTVWADIDSGGCVTAFGQEVRACALGQASAALFGDIVLGLEAARFDALNSAVRDMLQGGSDAIPAPGERFSELAPAAPHKGRHGSILLPFDALGDIFVQWRAPGACETALAESRL